MMQYGSRGSTGHVRASPSTSPNNPSNDVIRWSVNPIDSSPACGSVTATHLTAEPTLADDLGVAGLGDRGHALRLLGEPGHLLGHRLGVRGDARPPRRWRTRSQARTISGRVVRVQEDLVAHGAPRGRGARPPAGGRRPRAPGRSRCGRPRPVGPRSGPDGPLGARPEGPATTGHPAPPSDIAAVRLPLHPSLNPSLPFRAVALVSQIRCSNRRNRYRTYCCQAKALDSPEPIPLDLTDFVQSSPGRVSPCILGRGRPAAEATHRYSSSRTTQVTLSDSYRPASGTLTPTRYQQ